MRRHRLLDYAVARPVVAAKDPLRVASMSSMEECVANSRHPWFRLAWVLQNSMASKSASATRVSYVSGPKWQSKHERRNQAQTVRPERWALLVL